MATMKQLDNVALAIVGIDTGVAETFVTQALNIAQTGMTAWHGDEPSEKDVTTVVNKVTERMPWGVYVGSKKANEKKILSTRQKEVKDVCYAYSVIGEACEIYRDCEGTLRREHFVKMCKLAPTMPDAETCAATAQEFFEARAKKRGTSKSATPEEKLLKAMDDAIDAATELGNVSLARSLRTLKRNHSVA